MTSNPTEPVSGQNAASENPRLPKISSFACFVLGFLVFFGVVVFVTMLLLWKSGHSLRFDTWDNLSGAGSASTTPREFTDEGKTEFHGRVLLPDGSPAKGVEVFIYWSLRKSDGDGTSSFETPTTDENGEYRFHAPPDAFLVIHWRDTEKNDTIKGFAKPVLGRTATVPQKPGEYDLQLEQGTRLYGKVSYANEEPAANKFITVRTTRSSGSFSFGAGFLAKTDKEGRYSVQLCPDKYELSTNLSNEKYDIQISPGAKEKEFDFTIPVPRKGRVVRLDGTPVSGAYVDHRGHYPSTKAYSSHDSFSGSYSTDENGDFDYTMAPRWNRFAVRTGDKSETGVAIVEDGAAFGEDETLMITVMRPVVAEFRLKSKADDKPLIDWPVELYSLEHRARDGWGGHQIGKTQTDSTGEVSFSKLDIGGEYLLRFQSVSFFRKDIEVVLPLHLDKPTSSVEKDGVVIEWKWKATP